MRYKIEFELPDNDTVLERIKIDWVNWSICGYGGTAKAQPTIEPEQRWIPVSERLPEDNESKLACLSTNDFDIAWYSHDDRRWYYSGYSDDYPLCPQVIAWKSIEPYKGDE